MPMTPGLVPNIRQLAPEAEPAIQIEMVEPGDTPWEALLSRIEHGILMRTNASWSIDDSRNKFQFGCEWGQVIRNGRLAEVVKNPNYRGISATFWRSLAGVGDPSTVRVLGKTSGVSVKELYELFPKGPAKMAARIAGIPKPKGCI